MSATVLLAVADGKSLPVWAERRIRDRARAEAEWMARELERPVALVVRITVGDSGRIVAGICDRFFLVRMHGLEPLPRATSGYQPGNTHG